MNIDTAAEAATRIVELRERQNSEHMTPDVRNLLSAEERALWDRFYSGLPLDAIEAIQRYN